MAADLAQRLQSPPAGPLFLDGPTGTQLEAAGFVSHPLLWTASASVEAPDLLAAIHRRYVAAGAHCLTANTFRTTAFAAQQAGVDVARVRGWARQAVQLARDACRQAADPRWVLGSMAPLCDCYQPAQVPPDAILDREHARNADWLLDAGCDGLLIETQGSSREALCALRAARRHFDGPVLLSFLLAEPGDRLLGGDGLVTTARACIDAGATAILLNCAHFAVVQRGLQQLATGLPTTDSGSRWLGAYPNADRCERQGSDWRWVADPDARRLLLPRARQLWAQGARIVGLCCGFGPADLAQMIAAISPARVLGPTETPP